MKLAINAFNIRMGGGVTHLVELLSTADPQKYGFSEIGVWSTQNTLALLPDRPWLKKNSPRAFNKNLLHKLWWNFRYFSRELENYDLLFIPGGTYFGKFQPFVNMFQNALPFEEKEKRRFLLTSPEFYIKWSLLRFTQAFTFKRNLGAIFPSRYLESLVRQKVNFVCQYSIVIPHGVNPIFFNPPQTHPEKLINKKLIRIIYVSRIDFYKHQWNVIKAVATLRSMGFPVRLDLYGYVGNQHALKKMMAEIKLVDSSGDFVEYHGHLEYRSLPMLYEKTDIFVFASSCESISSILLEAMASGCAIACSKIPAAEELLKDAGIYFNPENKNEIKNAIWQLITDDELRQICKKKAYHYAKKYSWNNCADQTFSFLQKVVLSKN